MSPTAERVDHSPDHELVDGDELPGDEPLDDEERPAPRSTRVVTLVRIALAGLLFVIVAAVVGFWVAPPGAPSEDSVAAGLARDMIDHHAQAVDMASIIQGRTQDDAVRYLATDIILTQTNQMGQMQGWLNVWGLSLGRDGKPMEWMSEGGHSGMDMGSGGSSMLQSNGLMPGMATQADVNSLRSLPVKQADIRFLQLMIKHHQGGVQMAQGAIDATDERVVVRLCRTIVKAQNSEIALMEKMLAERGA